MHLMEQTKIKGHGRLATTVLRDGLGDEADTKRLCYAFKLLSNEQAAQFRSFSYIKQGRQWSRRRVGAGSRSLCSGRLSRLSLANNPHHTAKILRHESFSVVAVL